MNSNRYTVKVIVQNVNTNEFNGEYRNSFQTVGDATEYSYRHATQATGEARFVELTDLDTNGLMTFKQHADGGVHTTVTGIIGSAAVIEQEQQEQMQSATEQVQPAQFSVAYLSFVGMWVVGKWIDDNCVGYNTFRTRKQADTYAQHMAETERYNLIDWSADGQAELTELVEQVKFCMWSAELTGQVEIVGDSAQLACSGIDVDKATELIENLNANNLNVTQHGNMLLIQAM